MVESPPIYNLMMVKNFIDWLTGELNRRNWSNSELSRRSGLAQSTISMVISQQSNPGWEFCARVAKAFGMPVEKVFHLAGLISASPESVPGENELIHVYRNLGQSQRVFLIDVVRGLARDPALPCPPQLNEVRVVYSPRAQTAAPGLDDILVTLRQLEPADLKDIHDYARFKLAQHEPAEPAAASGDPDAAGEPVEMINLAGKDYPATEIKKAVEAVVGQLSLDDWSKLQSEIAENMRQEVQGAGRGQPEPEQPAKTSPASSGKKPST